MIARPLKTAAIIAMMASIPSPAVSASYLCSVKAQSFCTNGKPCKTQPYDDSDYFIVDITAQTFEECRVEDCRTRMALFWKTDDQTVIISHRDIPRTTRLAIHSWQKPPGASYTQATQSSVMTVVQSGDCFERVAIPPPQSIKP